MSSVHRAQLESEVLASCDRGEVARAVTLILEGYGPEVLAFLAAITKDLDEADEVFSHFCEDLWRGLPSFERRSPLRTWVYALSRNALRQHLRSEKRHRQHAVPLAEVGPLSELVARIRSTRSRLRSELGERVARLRRQLPKDDQILLILRIDRRMEWAEVARVLGEDPAAEGEALVRETARLRQRFQVVKEKLRGLAEKAGIVVENRR